MLKTRGFDQYTLLPTKDELELHFRLKYGPPESAGPAPRRRHRFNYYPPAEIYEAMVSKQVREGIDWIDIGGGHAVFPENPRLAEMLVKKCNHVTAIDPSPNVLRNDLVHERVQRFIEKFQGDRLYDLATLRMVAEHVADPTAALRSIHRLLKPNGKVILLTVNQWSPISLVARLTPFGLHHPIKRLFWGGKEEDTFPVQYKMNTQSVLKRLFEEQGFAELDFAYLDDCSTFGLFPWLNWLELVGWKVSRAILGFYPENCLLGIYQKVA